MEIRKNLEIAQLLKEKGYDEYTNFYIVTNDCKVSVDEETINFKKGQELDMSLDTSDFLCPEENMIPLPDSEDVIDWLIEKHGLYVNVNVNASGWYWEIVRVATGSTLKTSEYRGTNDGGCWDDRYDALKDGLIYCLKII